MGVLVDVEVVCPEYVAVFPQTDRLPVVEEFREFDMPLRMEYESDE